MPRASRLCLLAVVAFGALGAAAPASGAVLERGDSEPGAAACVGPCKMFFDAKGAGAGVLSISDPFGPVEGCIVPPVCARNLNYPEKDGVAYGVATVKADVTSGVFRGWENCPPGGQDGNVCSIDSQDFINTEYLCAIFTPHANSPLPEPGCPPPSIEPPPPPPDTVPPNTRITAAPARSTTSRRATFRFRSTELGSRFVCKLDARPWLPCGSPKTYARLKRGVHTFRVKAIDTSGNVDQTPDVRRWRVRA